MSLQLEASATGEGARRDAAAEELAAFGVHNTHVFSLAGRAGWARVVDAPDGDTLSAVSRVFGDGGDPSRVQVRLAGIDTPELDSADPAARERAAQARARLLELVSGASPEEAAAATTRTLVRALLAQAVHLVWLECAGADKYGRTLARVRPAGPAGACVTEALLAEGLAVPYTK